jgi:hypothetical protein
MKTTLNQKMNLQELNSTGDRTAFSHKVLRTKLIAEMYFNPKKHTKGKFYIETTSNQVMLFAAYKDLNGKCIYAPFIGFNKNNA